jgi:hypothetical protein
VVNFHLFKFIERKVRNVYILKLDRIGGLDRAINLDESVLFTFEKYCHLGPIQYCRDINSDGQQFRNLDLGSLRSLVMQMMKNQAMMQNL